MENKEIGLVFVVVSLKSGNLFEFFIDETDENKKLLRDCLERKDHIGISGYKDHRREYEVGIYIKKDEIVTVSYSLVKKRKDENGK